MHAGFGLEDLAQLRDHRSRAITAENPDGAVGAGGQAASDLGPGRKGSAWIPIDSGVTTELADIEGPGVIRHIWITVPPTTDEGDHVFRDLVLRMYWDDEESPSVEVPLGDFFANGHARRDTIDSMPVVVAPIGGFNSYWPMPFRERAEITIESEHPGDIGYFFFQIDYSLVPDLDEETGYFHAQWRRGNPVPRGTDHTIVDGIEGRGHYVGTYLAWTTLESHWWGEGEVKCYIDGDQEYPTICGTGTEDYVGGAWGFGGGEGPPQTYATPFLGYRLLSNDAAVNHHGLYRWHIADPIHFSEDLRVEVQQIGNAKRGFFERSDDIASVAYWYQAEPHAAFPDLPAADERIPR